MRKKKIQDNHDQEAMKKKQADQEKRSIMYNTARLIFELQCIELGLQESALLDYGEAGIFATVKPLAFKEEEKAKRFEYVMNRIKDLHKMTGADGQQSSVEAVIEMLGVLNETFEDTVFVEESSIVGADGEPMKKANLPKEGSKE